ncbi:MAG TPA: hypothetical protein VHY35_15265 [Stellaceae bacterium]|jgi:hypothetical protein|nr:hypothetical protein [Stellaceae bacterium]
MVRHLMTTAGALALMSSVALAQDASSTTITRTPDGVSKSTTEHHVDSYGNPMTEKKTYKDGTSGSSTSESRTMTDPESGDTVTKSRTTTDK